MDAYTSVSLSARNWHRVLTVLRDRTRALDNLLDGTPHLGDSDARRSTFVQREELRGVIEQIEDQLRGD